MFEYRGKHRGQVVLRDAVGQRRGPDSYAPIEGRDPWTYYLVAGCVETDPGALPLESVVPFVLGDRRGTFELSLGAPRPGLNDGIGSRARGYDFGNVLTAMEVPSPGGFGNLLAHGGLFMRRTRFPSPEGRETLAFTGILRAGPDMPVRFMLAFEGEGAQFRLDPAAPGSRPAPETFPVGSAPTQTFSLPIWGFEDEPRGFTSTLDLDTMDEMKEFAALKAVAEPDAEQSARLRHLERTEGGHVLRGSYGDRRFVRWREIARELGQPIDPQPDTYPTAAEGAALRRVADQAARLLMEEERASTYVSAPVP